MPAAPPRLVYSVYSSLIRRVNTDGANQLNVYSTTYPRVLDFDFRSVVINFSIFGIHSILLYACRENALFWVDFTNDIIKRAPGVETPSTSTMTNFLTRGISCTGKAFKLKVIATT